MSDQVENVLRVKSQTNRAGYSLIGGLLPLALDGGPLWEGMAWCMISGLIVATMLTLLAVPALYAIFVETLGAKVFQ